MAYIGKTPITGNFVKLDAISVVNGQAAYTMNNGGSAFTDYENVNQFLVSLNGILQAPTDSFTVSGSTITFASNLSTGDVIDFIIVLGNTLDIGTPSDATVTQAKTNFVSTSSSAGLQIKGDGTTDGTLQLNCSQNSHGIKLKSPPHSASASYTLTFPTTDGNADEFLQTNGSGTLTWATAGGGLVQLATTDITSSVSAVNFDGIFTSEYDNYYIIGNDLLNASSDTGLRMRYRQSNSDLTSANYVWHQQTLRDNGSYTRDDNGGVGDTLIALTGGNTTSLTGNRFQFDVTLYNPLSTSANKICSFNGFNVYVGSGTSYYYSMKGHGFWNGNQSALSGVSFLMSSGNLTDGRITVYGIKRS